MNQDELQNTVLCGDALEMLKRLPDEYVQMCVTSPPYYGLRDYGAEGQIGCEQTPFEYIDRLTEIFREVRRVLKSNGTHGRRDALAEHCRQLRRKRQGRLEQKPCRTPQKQTDLPQPQYR